MRRRRRFWYLRRRPEPSGPRWTKSFASTSRCAIEELRRAGCRRDDARREALRQFGDLEGDAAVLPAAGSEKENRVQRLLMFEDLAQDLRICLRGLLRAPVLTLTIVVTVGLGIGATTAIFAPSTPRCCGRCRTRIPNGSSASTPTRRRSGSRFSVADYLALEAQQTHFEQIAGLHRSRDGLQRRRRSPSGCADGWCRGRTSRLLGISRRSAAISPNRTAGRAVRPRSIVSHGFWQSGWAAGAMSSESRSGSTAPTTRWSACCHRSSARSSGGRTSSSPRSVDAAAAKGPVLLSPSLGRLREGVSRSAAASELRAINRRIFPIWKSSYQDDRPRGA